MAEETSNVKPLDIDNKAPQRLSRKEVIEAVDYALNHLEERKQQSQDFMLMSLNHYDLQSLLLLLSSILALED